MAFSEEKFIEKAVADAASAIRREKAIMALSGGVDSSVCAAIMARAIGGRLEAIFVDTGLMRANEAKHAREMSKKAGIRLRVIEAQNKFFDALKGVEDPEKKRKIIGGLFVRLFEEEAKKSGAKFLVQGTIAPDWIESGGSGRRTIKSHHNVGGLPEKMGLKVYEPLRDCYKHEVRLLAQALKLPPEISGRQPFPGPGLAVRIVGEITPEKAGIVRKCCQIVEEEIEGAAASKSIELPWQYFAALLPSKTVGVRGDERAYQYTAVVRAVRSLDGMTANFSHLPPELLQKISSRITNEVREVGRVLYDVTNKPPATVELE